MNRKASLDIWLAVWVLVLAGPAGAVTHYVWPGDSIQGAIDDANDGDKIAAATGTYREAIDFKGKAVRLYSRSGPGMTTIDGSGYPHVVQCVGGEGPDTILEGFTITGGNAFVGGGMYNTNGSSPTVTNCVFNLNTAEYGGGMYNGYGSDPNVTNCTFWGNTATVWGGGMYNKLSNPTVTNCVFYNNTGNWDGGGMCNEQSSPTVTDCNFADNDAQHSGGGMYNNNCSPVVTNCSFWDNEAYGETTDMGGGGMYNLDNSNSTVSNCTFSGNWAMNYGGGMCNVQSNPAVTSCTFNVNRADGVVESGGGGMSNLQSSPRVANCTFNDNKAGLVGVAPMFGGGIYNSNCSPTVINCTFSGNRADGPGGGMYNLQSSPALYNCILWGDLSEIYDSNSTTSVFFSDVQGGWGGVGIGNIDADPLFVDAAGGDLRLSSSASPCVDTGTNSAAGPLATDLAGNPRVVDGDLDGTATVDMGAYELQPKEIHNITQDSWYETIQRAIDDANDGDEIEVAPGTYYEAINLKGMAIRLYSSGGPEVTTIDASGVNSSVVTCNSGEDANTILRGFTITGGNATRGGGMCNDGSSPTVTNCTFANNEADVGGGMDNLSSSPTLTGCTFAGNSARAAGGMNNYQNSSPSLTNCAFTGNIADEDSGGMSNHTGCSVILTNCTFTNNSAVNSAGGMQNAYSSPTLSGCTFNGNSAGMNGGAILNRGENSDTALANCTFSGNSAGSGGGGMLSSASSPTVTNCAFTDNTAGNQGGAMRISGGSPSVTNCTFAANIAFDDGEAGGGIGGGIVFGASSAVITNCTFTNNFAVNDAGALWLDSGDSVTNCIIWGNSDRQIANVAPVTYSDVQGGYDGEGNIDADPCFVDAYNPDPNLWSLRLEPDSPCIDAGDTTAVPGGVFVDVEGNPRVVDDPASPDTGISIFGVTVDMGAYEFQPCPIAGDINCDGVVDFKDLAILCNNWLAGAEPKS